MAEKAQKLILDGDLDENNTLSSSGNSNCNVDKGYFNIYSHFAIHHEMLTVCICIFFNNEYDSLIMSTSIFTGQSTN